MFESLQRVLPQPSGYRVLLAIPKTKDTFESGILKADLTKQVETVANVIGVVLKLGPDAYQDKEKFPSGPYCKEGDFVVIRAYSGTRISVNGEEVRLVNDDTIEAVVPDPTVVRRAG